MEEDNLIFKAFWTTLGIGVAAAGILLLVKDVAAEIWRNGLKDLGFDINQE